VISEGLAGTLDRGLRMVLGDTVGGLLAWLPSRLISGVGGAVSSLAGASVAAIISPIKAALAAPLSDFSLWTNRAVEAEAATTRFTATAGMMAQTVGFTAEQLGHMAEGLSNVAGASPFSVRQVRDAEQELLQFDRVRGQVFRRVMDLSVQLAALKGTGIDEAVRTLGMAMSNPEQGAHRLRHAGIFLSPADQQGLQQLQDSNGTLAAQEKLLDILEGKWKGISAQMAGTTEGILGTIRTVWGSIGSDIGKVFLPLTRVLGEGTLEVVKMLAGTARPVLQDLAAVTGRWADGIRGFFAENAPMFREWSALVKDIVMNVYQLAKQGLAALFGEMRAGGVKDFWQGFAGGVTDALRWVKALTSSWEALKAGGELAWVAIKNAGMDLVDWIASSDTWSSLWETLKSGFKNVMEWVVDVFSKLADVIGDKLNKAILPGDKSKGAWLLLKHGGPLGVVDALKEAAQDIADEQKHRDALEKAIGAGPGTPGQAGAASDSAARVAALAAAREKFESLTGDSLSRAAQEAAQAARSADLLMVQGAALEDQLKLSSGRSMGIGDLHKAIQESVLRPTGAGQALAKAQAADIAAQRALAEKSVETLNRISRQLAERKAAQYS
jgi:hypothetical protein